MSVAILNGPTVTEFVEDTEAFDKCVDKRFEVFDVNGDGVLSRSELQTGFGRLLTLEYESRSEEEIISLYDTVFENFDTDQNGTIDRNEFRFLMKEIMLAVARGIGNSPVHVALEADSLLTRAVEHELLAKHEKVVGKKERSTRNLSNCNSPKTPKSSIFGRLFPKPRNA